MHRTACEKLEGYQLEMDGHEIRSPLLTKEKIIRENPTHQKEDASFEHCGLISLYSCHSSTCVAFGLSVAGQLEKTYVKKTLSPTAFSCQMPETPELK